MQNINGSPHNSDSKSEPKPFIPPRIQKTVSEQPDFSSSSKNAENNSAKHAGQKTEKQPGKPLFRDVNREVGKILENSTTDYLKSGGLIKVPVSQKEKDGSEWEAVAVYPWAHCYFAQPNSTVKILSGYLNVVSTPFAPPDHANSASSTVDFGNRTAYVYVNQQNSTADIGCRVAGTAGFVKSAGGTLQLHQPMDGLSGGVWVGAGRLSLLDDATLGDNDVAVAAGAKLRIAGVSPFGRDARLDLEDRDWISTNSRVELDNGAENRVRRLYVNGVSQKRGTYGATGSGAEFIDDKHFSGTGTVRVLRDDLANPLVIRMK